MPSLTSNAVSRDKTSLVTKRAPRAHYRGEDYSIDESVGYLVRRIQASLLRHIDRRFHLFDLTALQWSPLLLIAQKKGNTAAALARALDIDTGAMTRMLDRLESKKLLQRTRSTGDRRVVHLELTREGQRVVQQVPFVLADVLNLHLDGFSASELKQLMSLLRRIIANGDRGEGNGNGSKSLRNGGRS
jgi:DNA-binding MarR family transcriptional regulator